MPRGTREAIAHLWPHRHEGSVNGVMAHNALRWIIKQERKRRMRYPS